MVRIKNALLIIFTCLISFLSKCQPINLSEHKSSFYPYYFETVRVKLIQLQYKQVLGKTVEHIPHKVLDSLVYRVDFVVKFYPDHLVWDNPVVLVVNTQNRQKEYWFNRQGNPLSNQTERTFQFIFKTPARAPWAEFILCTPVSREPDSLIYKPDYQNVFKARQIELPEETGQFLIF